MTQELPWARAVDGGRDLALRIQPGARRSEVVGVLASALKVRVTAPAGGGKANAELVRFLAQELDVARRAVTVIRGEHRRTKTVRVTGAVDLRRLNG